MMIMMTRETTGTATSPRRWRRQWHTKQLLSCCCCGVGGVGGVVQEG